MKFFYTMGLCLLAILQAAGQELPRQTVKGLITDRSTHYPLPGAAISIPTLSKGAATNEKGEFRITEVPVGRHTIQITMMGYEPVILQGVEVNAGKETVLEIPLTETVITLKGAEITMKRSEGPGSSLALASARQLSIEEGMRYAGSRNDPARMAQNFAGVSGANDGRNDIIIRGNSPAGVLWRAEGVDIPNPNHYSTFGATGGPVTILNTNTLRNSTFLTGAFPADYGNALAGAFDLRLRNGNKDRYEMLAQVGFNGFEAAVEGPLGKKGGASFLVDYRYSLVAAVHALGLNVGTGASIPKYQDLTMKVNVPTKKAGTFSLFAMGGLSNIHFIPGEDSTDLYNTGDYEVLTTSNMGVAGLTHSFNFSPNTYGRAFAAVSMAESKMDNFESKDEIRGKRRLDLDYNLMKTSFGYRVDHKFNPRNQFSVGVSGESMQLDMRNRRIKDGDTELSDLVNTSNNTWLGKSWMNWQHRVNNDLTFNAGVYGQYFGLNEQFQVEPRVNMKYDFARKQSFNLGLGMHSQLQQLEVYFNETAGKLSNKDLAPTRALHAVLGYDAMLGERLRFKAETYYQHLYEAPVEITSSSFSLLNYGADFGFPDKPNLFNNGKGRNYGVELTLEKFLHKGFYFLFTQSLFSSKYQGSDKIWRNTAFNSQYVTNFLIGREWTIKPGFSVGADSKVSVAGGQWYTPFNEQATVAAGYVVYQEDKAFSLRNDMYFRCDLKFSFTWELGRTTQKFFIDLQNLTARKNIYTRTIDVETGKIKQVNQIGLFPNVNYQFTF
ncbi:TonB-dependent receptor [Chitinophaga deserti]|uniref:TonB-dependent receptor n=1 Tax=Chitinophaga deserti TaxID=2164099 RepID=UPI000D6CDD67|nr:TonB-dependent receptor [Chitinophaga deserti]